MNKQRRAYMRVRNPPQGHRKLPRWRYISPKSQEQEASAITAYDFYKETIAEKDCHKSAYILIRHHSFFNHYSIHLHSSQSDHQRLYFVLFLHFFLIKQYCFSVIIKQCPINRKSTPSPTMSRRRIPQRLH